MLSWTTALSLSRDTHSGESMLYVSWSSKSYIERLDIMAQAYHMDISVETWLRTRQDPVIRLEWDLLRGYKAWITVVQGTHARYDHKYIIVMYLPLNKNRHHVHSS